MGSMGSTSQQKFAGINSASCSYVRRLRGTIPYSMLGFCRLPRTLGTWLYKALFAGFAVAVLFFN
jgi:hypothetical protein